VEERDPAQENGVDAASKAAQQKKAAAAVKKPTADQKKAAQAKGKAEKKQSAKDASASPSGKAPAGPAEQSPMPALMKRLSTTPALGARSGSKAAKNNSGVRVVDLTKFGSYAK
jgi:hypothetical protein